MSSRAWRREPERTRLVSTSQAQTRLAAPAGRQRLLRQELRPRGFVFAAARVADVGI